jgi:hypothetical protein
MTKPEKVFRVTSAARVEALLAELRRPARPDPSAATAEPAAGAATKKPRRTKKPR